MATGDATTIRLQRERAEVERLIYINALNHRAMDRYNHLSYLLSKPGGAVTIPED